MPNWTEILQILFGGSLSVVTFFAVRALDSITKSQEELFNRVKELEHGFHALKGEHEVLKNFGGCKNGKQ